VADHECDGVSKNNVGDTPLMAAAAEGHEEVVHFLATRFQESLDWRNRLGVTAIMVAAMAGRDGVINVCPPLTKHPPCKNIEFFPSPPCLFRRRLMA